MNDSGQPRVLLVRPAGPGPAISRYADGLAGLLRPSYSVEQATARHFEPGRILGKLTRRSSLLAGVPTDPAIVHFADVYMTPQARRFTGARVVTVHDLMPREFRRIRSRRALTFALVVERSLRKLKDVDLVLAPSEYTRRQVVSQCGVPASKVVVVPPTFPAAMVPAPFETREPRTIVSIGPELYYKNLDLLIHALAEPELRDATLLRVGGLSGRLREVARRLGVEQRITDTGFVTDEELIGVYQRGTVLAHPSYSEGFGLPVAEAMLCGLPAVVSDGGSLPEVVGAAGRVVPLRGRRPRQEVNMDDTRDFACALNQVLNDEDLRRSMSRSGLAEAERFSPSAVRSRLLDAYDLALSNSRRRR